MLINISDHHTRTKANTGSTTAVKVLGILLGSQDGRTVDISNSFEIKYEQTAEGVQLDQAFLVKRQEQCELLMVESMQCKTIDE